MEAQNCPICGMSTLKKDIRTEIFEYENITITIPNYAIYQCNKCGETIIDKTTLKKSGDVLKNLKINKDNCEGLG